MSSEHEPQDDPQIVLRGRLKSTERSDIIVFKLKIALFELVFIVTVPPEGETEAPVYVKHRIRRPERAGFSAEVRRARRAPSSDLPLSSGEDVGYVEDDPFDS